MTLLQIFGSIATPPAANFKDLNNNGLTLFISRTLSLFFIIAGLYVLINIVTAGFQYLSGDSQNVSAAWAKIWQSFMGLLIIGAALILTSIISWFVFGDPSFILNPKILTP